MAEDRVDFDDLFNSESFKQGGTQLQAFLIKMFDAIEKGAKESLEATTKQMEKLALSASKMKGGDLIEKSNTLIKESAEARSKLTEAQKSQAQIQKALSSATAKETKAQKKNIEGKKLLLAETEKIINAYRKEAGQIGKLDKQMTGYQKRINDLERDKNALNKAIRSGVGDQTKNAEALQRVKTQLVKYKSHMREATNAASGLTAAGLRFRDKVAGGLVKQFKRIGIAAVAAFSIGKIKQFFSGVIDTIVDFDSAVASLKGITGLDENGVQPLIASAQEMGLEYGKGATQIIEAFEKVGSARPELLKDTEALKQVTEAALLLQKTSPKSLSLDEAVASVTSTLNQMNEPASRAVEVVNALAAGSKEGSAPVDKITQALEKFGATLSSSNATTEEGIALIEVLAKKQIVGAEAGTNLRTVLLKLNTAKGLPKEAITQMEKFGVDIDKVADKTLPLNERLRELGKISEDSTALVKVFGEGNVEAGQIILQNVDSFETLTKSVTGTNTAFDQATETNKTLAFQQQKTEAAYENMILSVDKGDGVVSKAVRGWEKLKQGLFSMLTVQNTESDRIATQQIALNGLVDDLLLAEKGTDARTTAIIKLNDQYPGFLKNLDAESASNEEIAATLKEVNIALDKQIELKAAQEEQTEANEEFLEVLEKRRDLEKEIREQAKAFLKDRGVDSIGLTTVELVEKMQEVSGGAEVLGTTLQTLTGGTLNPFNASIETITSKFDRWTRASAVVEEAQEKLASKTDDVEVRIAGVTDELGRLQSQAEEFIPFLDGFGLDLTAGVKVDPDTETDPKKAAAARKKARDKRKAEEAKAAALRAQQEKQLQDLRTASIKDEEERKIKALKLSAERDIRAIEGVGKIQDTIRKQIEENTLTEIAKIRAEFRKKEADAAQAELDKKADAAKKEAARAKKQWEREQADRAIAAKIIAEDERKKREAVRDTILFVAEITAEAFDKEIKQLDDKLQASIDVEKNLLRFAEGRALLENESLVAEREKQAKIKEQLARTEKAQKLAQLITELTTAAFSTYQAKVDAGDQQPLTSTIKDISLLKTFIGSLAGFYHGTESVDGTGMHKLHSGIDGYLALVNQGERIVPDYENKKLPKGMGSAEMVDRVVNPGYYMPRPDEPRMSQQAQMEISRAGSGNREQIELTKTLISEIKALPDNMPVSLIDFDYEGHADYILEMSKVRGQYNETFIKKRSGLPKGRELLDRRRG